MSIEWRGGRPNIRWRNKATRKRERFAMAKGTPRREAEAMDRKVQNAVREHGFWAPARSAPVDLEQLVDRYIAERTEGTIERPAAKPRTLMLYETVLRRQFLAHCRGTSSKAPPLFMLDKQPVSEFLEKKRKEGRHPGTVHNYARGIRAFWGWAREAYPEHVFEVRMPRVHVPPPRRVLAATYGEIDRMLAQLTDRGDRVRRAVLIQRFTGLRIEQVGSFVWDDFDGDWEGLGTALHVRVGKSAQETALDRWIPVAPPLTRLLLAWRMADGRPDGDVRIVGGPLPRDVSITVRKAWERSGVPEERWKGHPTRAFRKRLISHMTEQGISDAAIDHLVGHAPRGVRARHYVDPRAFWPVIEAAVATLPPLDDELQQVVGA